MKEVVATLGRDKCQDLAEMEGVANLHNTTYLKPPSPGRRLIEFSFSL